MLKRITIVIAIILAAAFLPYYAGCLSNYTDTNFIYYKEDAILTTWLMGLFALWVVCIISYTIYVIHYYYFDN